MTPLKTQNNIQGIGVLALIFILLFILIGSLSFPGTYTAEEPLAIASTPTPKVLGVTEPARGEAVAVAPKPTPVEVKPVDTSKISARHFLVYDLDSGTTMAEKSADAPVPIASLTKLMTALVTYENSDLNQTVIVPPISSAVVRPVLSLRAGNRVKILDLFNAMLVGSANDAAYVLGVTIMGPTKSSFVQAMNDKAAALGMGTTHFSNPLGYDSDFNYSSARDLQTLVQTLDAYTAFKVLGKMTTYRFTDEDGTTYSVSATNKLVRSHADVYAVKTGYTDSAQGAMITKIVRDGHTIVCIVLESPERENDTLALADQVFASYEWR